MQVNGKKALGSGTLVLKANEAGAIEIEHDHMTVRFANDAGPSRIDLDRQSGGFLFYNFDAVSLGAFVSLTIQSVGGPVTIRFAVWAMGSPLVGRVVHYTATAD